MSALALLFLVSIHIHRFSNKASVGVCVCVCVLLLVDTRSVFAANYRLLPISQLQSNFSLLQPSLVVSRLDYIKSFEISKRTLVEIVFSFKRKIKTLAFPLY